MTEWTRETKRNRLMRKTKETLVTQIEVLQTTNDGIFSVLHELDQFKKDGEGIVASLIDSMQELENKKTENKVLMKELRKAVDVTLTAAALLEKDGNGPLVIALLQGKSLLEVAIESLRKQSDSDVNKPQGNAPGSVPQSCYGCQFGEWQRSNGGACSNHHPEAQDKMMYGRDEYDGYFEGPLPRTCPLKNQGNKG